MLDIDMGNEATVSLEPTVAQQEAIANAAAANFCVPTKMMDAFISRKAPYFSDRDLVGFAKVMKVHPGLVAGQLQRHTGHYHKFRKHLAPVREFITPSADTDGWGDVYPTDD
jgi:HTH-type transcriptional regulator/antitoxin HigA